jgi:small-conductance mechanosensitive channel
MSLAYTTLVTDEGRYILAPSLMMVRNVIVNQSRGDRRRAVSVRLPAAIDDARRVAVKSARAVESEADEELELQVNLTEVTERGSGFRSRASRRRTPMWLTSQARSGRPVGGRASPQLKRELPSWLVETSTSKKKPPGILAGCMLSSQRPPGPDGVGLAGAGRRRVFQNVEGLKVLWRSACGRTCFSSCCWNKTRVDPGTKGSI